MLTKNVYILYPPGHSGSYVSWAISASDADLAKTTVKNPINNTASTKYGGEGTAHLHHRVPTHQSWDFHAAWMMFNRPTDTRIYIIHARDYTISKFIAGVLLYDKDPVFIIVHNDNDYDTWCYGRINCIKKWPAHPMSGLLRSGYTAEDIKFDPYNCKDSKELRNSITKFDDLTKAWSVPLTKIQDEKSKNRLTECFEKLHPFFNIRGAQAPHEINSNYYIIPDKFPWQKIYQLSCTDVVSDQFPDLLENILQQSQCTDNYNTTQLREIQPDYIIAQKNMQWFESIAHWRETGEIDTYLLEHMMTHGLVLREILENSGFLFPTMFDTMTWQHFYNNVRGHSWPTCMLEQDYITLPESIRTELKEVFNYKPKFDNPLVLEFRDQLLNWRDMTLIDANRVFQQYRYLLGKINKPAINFEIPAVGFN
jgi:hypothetical protein